VEVFLHKEADIDGSDSKKEMRLILFHMLNKLLVALNKPEYKS
jgi:hypothetical protein